MARAMCISNVNGCLDIILYTCPGILYCIHEFDDSISVFFRELAELFDAVARIAFGLVAIPHDGLEGVAGAHTPIHKAADYEKMCNIIS